MLRNPSAPGCIWCKRPAVWARAGISTGFKVTAYCFDCDKPATTQLATAKGNFTRNAIDAMPWVKKRGELKCPICSSFVHELEWHHLAPKERFGAEAELWPKVQCCRPCHERWHARMGCPINLAEAAEEEE